ncbi:MAG TPA: alpha/beta hydrolase [Papillibacter sp.]|nr:alpha/beta hydrolase [Papillibacter sp.]
MKKTQKRKGVKWAVLILVAAAAVGVIWHTIGSLKNRSFLLRLTVGGNENVRLLNRLNEIWTLPEDFSLDVIEVDELTMEWVQKENESPQNAILQLHGGAYIRSLKDNGQTYRRAAVQYAKLSGAGVLTVDYRVAPEHPYPAALEDALKAYDYLMEQGYSPERIIIAGDSAGGGLALATALYLRDHDMPMPAGIITMSAWTNLNYKRWTPPYAVGARADDPYISPAYGAYHGFPPMLMQVGGDEKLLDDTTRVAQKAKDAGAELTQTTYPGMFHVFQMLFPELPEANTAWDEVKTFMDTVFPEIDRDVDARV